MKKTKTSLVNDTGRSDRIADVLKALAHPTRLKLVDELAAHEEACVCDLTEAVGSDMSTVSRHLSQLKNAGIVEDEKRGTTVYYRLRVKCIVNFFGCVEDAPGIAQVAQEAGALLISVFDPISLGILIAFTGSLFAMAGYGSHVYFDSVVMFIFLTKVTGIPHVEAQSLRSRGDAYRRYQATTSAFIPMPPRPMNSPRSNS